MRGHNASPGGIPEISANVSLFPINAALSNLTSQISALSVIFNVNPTLKEKATEC